MTTHNKPHEDYSSFTFDRYLKQLKVLHLAMLVGGVMNIFVLFYVMGFQFEKMESINSTLLMAVVTGLLAICYVGNMLFKKSMINVTADQSILKKLVAYRQAKVVNYAIVEGPLLLCAILGFTWKDPYLLIAALLSSIYFFTLRPSKEHFLQSIALSGSDKIYVNGNMTIGEHEKDL